MSRFSACVLHLRPAKRGVSSGLRLCHHNLGLPKWHGGRESASQSRRHRDARPVPESGRSLEGQLVACLSILPWEIPWTDPGCSPRGGYSSGGHRARHNWAHHSPKIVSLWTKGLHFSFAQGPENYIASLGLQTAASLPSFSPKMTTRRMKTRYEWALMTLMEGSPGFREVLGMHSKVTTGLKIVTTTHWGF